MKKFALWSLCNSPRTYGLFLGTCSLSAAARAAEATTSTGVVAMAHESGMI